MKHNDGLALARVLKMLRKTFAGVQLFMTAVLQLKTKCPYDNVKRDSD